MLAYAARPVLTTDKNLSGKKCGRTAFWLRGDRRAARHDRNRALQLFEVEGF
jgi:hypothetical protein